MNNGCQTLIYEPGELPELESYTIPAEAYRNGLLVRSSNWLGDAVMTLPALKVLKTILPENCGLFVLSPKGLAPLYHALTGLVDTVIPQEDAHAFPNRQEKFQLKMLHAGAGILFNNSFRDALALRLCGVKYLFGARARNRSWLLKKSWAFPPRIDHELNYPHQSTKYLAMAYALGAEKWDGIMPELYPHAIPEQRTDNLYDLLASPHVLAIAPGAAYGDAKRWAPENFRETAKWWQTRYSDGIVLALGGKAERAGAEQAVAGLDPERTVNLAGKTSLDELMVVLSRAKMCLANDSGIMHLSGALGGQGIAVFGSTDPAATAPVSTKWRLLYDKLPCSPCFKRVCPDGSKKCMGLVAPAHVTAALDEMLNTATE